VLAEAAPRAEAQLVLAMQYRSLVRAGASPLSFAEVGFRACSQHEEDGILLYVFALIGTTNKRCVEICAGDGIECNTANLILNHRWIGLLCDGDLRNVERGRRFYARHPDTRIWPPVFEHAWITAENANAVVERNGFAGEIDLLSLDIDGIDYWLWKALDCVSPRVIVLEFNHLWGASASVTVPYDPHFKAQCSADGSDYAGASLAAFVKLGKQKGYRLVGTNAIATNAFFVRSDIPCDALPEIDPSQCFSHPRARYGMTHRLPRVKDMPWERV